MTASGRIGVVGGTFDPIHVGHLDAAEAAARHLVLDEMVFIPSHDPPHRRTGPHASALHRFAMVALAVAGHSRYRVSDDEMLRGGRSYTADSLRRLHAAGWRPAQIFFILGADAFAEIATWHEFPEVLDAAHFVVVARPGTNLANGLARNQALAPRVREHGLLHASDDTTSIVLIEARTRDVSSTAIRARIARGEPIDNLVPAAVAKHIAANGLYTTVNELHGQDESSKSASFEER